MSEFTFILNIAILLAITKKSFRQSDACAAAFYGLKLKKYFVMNQIRMVAFKGYYEKIKPEIDRAVLEGIASTANQKLLN